MKKTPIIIALILVLSLVLGACQPAAPAEEAAPAAAEEEAAAPEAEEAEAEEAVEEEVVEEAAAEEPAEEAEDAGEKQTVRFGDEQWQSLWIENSIATFIVENGYGYPTEIIEVTTPVMQQSLETRDLDVNMEIWVANLQEWWDAVREEGTVIDGGPIFESSAQGWYVPRYVIEGDEERGIEPMAPDLKTVDDLPQYAELFSDPEEPEKGLLVSCITGWQCAQVNRVKFHAYGLDETFNILEPGSQGALDAAIAGAYKKGEPVLAYYWEPTWLLGLYDMVMIEEPEFNAETWDEINQMIADEVPNEDIPETAGCAYENIEIPKAYTSDFADANPELAEFFDNMFIGTANLNKISAFMEENETTADEAAIWYFENYQDQWREWVPEDVAEKVQAAVDAAQ
jgi:glycine betaine/proline transport system substrate-binding protein